MTGQAFTRDGLVLAVTLAATLGMTPLARRAALRIGLVDRPGPNKYHEHATPYMGGLAIVVSILIALSWELTTSPEVRWELVAIGLGGLAVSAVGLIDDWRVLGALPRLTVQAAAGVGLWASGIRLAPTGAQPLDLAVTVFVVLAVTNSINLLDNMDGLSAGASAVAAAFFFAVAASQGQHLVGAMAAAVAGGCLGFLPYNYPPARIFLGDAGTLFLGFLLSVLFIKIKLPGYPLVTRAAVPLLIVTVPLFDTTLVVLSRFRAGRPVFRGATDHTSHRLDRVLRSPARVALITYEASALFGSLAVGLVLVHRAWATWAVVALTAVLGLVGLVLFEGLYAEEPTPTGQPKRGIKSGVVASAISAISSDTLRS